MNETQREQIKGALLKCAEENENKPTFTGYVVVSSVCKSAAERIEELEKQLEAEKKLNEEIKVRFVKCNTCTDEMKSKCLMFSENLCEGDRCEELVDLIELINKSDLQKENARLKKEYRGNLSLKDEELMCLETEFNTYKSEAKELIENIIRVTWGEGWNYDLGWKVKAENFLKE